MRFARRRMNHIVHLSERNELSLWQGLSNFVLTPANSTHYRFMKIKYSFDVFSWSISFNFEGGSNCTDIFKTKSRHGSMNILQI